ncbi:MAG: DUF3362 domain-containing protein, partial [Lachnospiraceae bacterium]|nr:DUF3362 domain-containing protein [Lachnospiraceae bacterium]
GPACSKQLTKGVCPNKQCLFPEVCKNVHADHKDYLELLRKLRKIPKVKKVFVRSGLRFDYILADPNGEAFLRELCKYHVSGQLRVAPEHVSTNVLSLMGKPKAEVYGSFLKMYERVNKSLGMEQFAVPYLMSSHPGSTLEDAIALAEAVRDLGYMPEQVQDYYPTPSTISTVMYYTGLDPRTMKKVYIPKTPHEKAMQRALIQYRKPENYDLVKEALIKCHREDLIGFDHSKCLIPPRKMSERPAYQGKPGSDKTRGGKARSDKSQGGNNNPQRSVAAKNRTDSKREASGSRPGTGRKPSERGRKKK